MKRIGFAFNPTSEQALELRERASEWCAARGIDQWSAPSLELESLVRQLPRTDVLVVLGGDGTFLNAARAVALVDVPILGVNSGKVGFLSKTDVHELGSVLDEVVRGDFTFESRMMLEAHILRGQANVVEGAVHVALNEAAVVRGARPRVVRLEVSIDESHLATYVADGIVLATPTGSTGYSFSAGGPILDPTARNLIVTPVAAYLSAIRSVVVSARHSVRVRVLDAHDCVVSIDGREDVPILSGDAVEVRARDQPIRFLEPRHALNFWDLVRTKAELLPS